MHGKDNTMKVPLRIATFNAENFYMLLDREYSQQDFEALSDSEYQGMNASIFNPNKTLGKIAAIAKTILDEDFDFVGLCELGGLETLVNFNKHYLQDRYDCFLHEENSKRGIFVGALVKKGRFTLVSAENMQGAFSRNLMQVTLQGGGTTLHIFVVHLKAQHGQDLGIEQRIAEVDQLCALVKRRRCVVLGDFNGILIRGENQFEYAPFLELPFRDVLEAMSVPAHARFSHFYFRGGLNFSQLDYIFCSNDLAILDGGMMCDLVPINYEQRRRLPSDHIFIKATIGP
ncbi:MAG: hypothetical protein A2Y38_01840 [Spirochaetes bacterium GWB1_59_5]|nr:MAG: hypothetical protein A2Y38_01840 [Spirochaetes bacterium GWB1_59_5]